jgi:MFS family permease
MHLRNIRTFDSLRIPAFRIYYLSMAGQWAAQCMQSVVQSLLLYRLTGSTAILGIMSLASAIPQIIVALYMGVLVDRFSKKRLMQIGQAVTAMTSIIIVVSLRTGYLSKAHPGSWWILVAMSAIQGMSGTLLWSARSAIVPELVSKERVANATSLTTIGLNTFQLVAPAFAGFLIDKINPGAALNFEVAFVTIVGLYLISICITNFMPAREVAPSGRGHVMADMIEGLKYVRNNTMLLWILIYTILCSMVVMPLSSMMSVFSDSILKVGGTGLGLLQGFSAAGSLITVLIMASLAIKKRSLMMLVMGLIIGLAQAVFAFSTYFPLSLILMVFAGAGTMGQINIAMIILQTDSDPAQRGRVLSVLLLGMGLSGLMSFFCGFIAEVIGIQRTIGGLSLLLVAATVLIFFLMPKLRKLE